MKALIKDGPHLSLADLPLPDLLSDQVRVSVKTAGLCRTDLLVMQNKLPSRNPLIPGHECAGVITECGTDVNSLEPGQKVSVNPMIGCGSCDFCLLQRPHQCADVKMLGMHLHGAFAEYIDVPARAVYVLPQQLSWQQAAYLEPLAAAFGIFQADIQSHQQGWVLGQNRISELSHRLLGLRGLQSGKGDLSRQADNSLDYIVETGLTDAQLPEVIHCLKPGGKLIAKTRHLESIAVPWQALVRKDIQIQGHYYGSFAEVQDFLNQDSAILDAFFDGLIGETYPLAQWADFVAAASENSKPFLIF